MCFTYTHTRKLCSLLIKLVVGRNPKRRKIPKKKVFSRKNRNEKEISFALVLIKSNFFLRSFIRFVILFSFAFEIVYVSHLWQTSHTSSAPHINTCASFYLHRVFIFFISFGFFGYFFSSLVEVSSRFWLVCVSWIWIFFTLSASTYFLLLFLTWSRRNILLSSSYHFEWCEGTQGKNECINNVENKMLDKKKFLLILSLQETPNIKYMLKVANFDTASHFLESKITEQLLHARNIWKNNIIFIVVSKLLFSPICFSFRRRFADDWRVVQRVDFIFLLLALAALLLPNLIVPILCGTELCSDWFWVLGSKNDGTP